MSRSSTTRTTADAEDTRADGGGQRRDAASSSVQTCATRLCAKTP
jgi:hypothetical protein